MKLTLSWLKEHLDTNKSAQEIADKLTAIGLEVEEMQERKDLAPFVVAAIEAVEKHPNADRLRLCTVNTGKETLKVVCGAPNAKAGMKGIFAPIGAIIPASQTKLKLSAIRGIESHGMMCSARELCIKPIPGQEEGIIELPGTAKIGTPAVDALGLADPIMEIKLTPNRPDCNGVYGVARDLAAAGFGRLKTLKIQPVAEKFKTSIGIKIEDKTACPMFAGRLIRGVKNGPSPKWMQDRLTAIGLRPISALVDITNYLTFDKSRPLHVFDAAKLKGDVVVRAAKKGESLAALDGKTYTLDDGMTVITDASQKPLSLGGVIGGESTGCSDATVNVFLECATFDPVRTAITGRKLNLMTDARYRFERGVDPASVLSGMEEATRLILEICGGEVGSVVVAGEEPKWQRTYTLRSDRCATLGGLSVPQAQQEEILGALGFTVVTEAGGNMRVSPPSWRNDIQGEADLVEEILRIIGYENIPTIPRDRMMEVAKPAVNAAKRRVMIVRRALASRGLEEAVTWSFTDGKVAALFGKIDDSMKLANPLSTDLDTVRPSVLCNLLLAYKRNAARGMGDVSLFEVGPAFHSGKSGDQMLVAGGIRAGSAVPKHWAEKQRYFDAFDVKADVMAALQHLGFTADKLQIVSNISESIQGASLRGAATAAGRSSNEAIQQSTQTSGARLLRSARNDASGDFGSYYHPGKSGTVQIGQTAAAYFGELHPSVLHDMDIDAPVMAFEVMMDNLPAKGAKAGAARPTLILPEFQALRRDFAFVVDKGVEAVQLTRAAKSADDKLITSVDIFDLYEGSGMPEDKKSLAITVTIQPTAATLTDAEIDALSKKICESVKTKTGAVLRG